MPGTQKRRETDMLWRIETTGGSWVYILILLEFQSTVDRRMALRIMDYTSTIWMCLGKEDLGPGGEYPLVLPIVIYNGERRWTAARDVADLLPPVPEELLGYQPRQRYLLIEIRAPGPGLAAAGAGRELQRKLRNEEEGTMSTLIERARKWGEERDQLWLQKGIEKGIGAGARTGAPDGQPQVRSRHRRTAPASAGADLRTGRHRTSRRRCSRMRERRGVPPAGAGGLTRANHRSEGTRRVAIWDSLQLVWR